MSTATPKRAAIYARVSSERQKEQETIASQTAALLEHATSRNWTVPSEWRFLDEGYSGATLMRPALDSLRDCIAEGQLDTVLVLSPDRLSRKYAYQILLMEEFQRHGVEVMFTPDAVSLPAIRTIGNGCIRASGAALTWIVSVTTLERPLASDTCSRTGWGPRLENEVRRTRSPALNWALLPSAHANCVIGLEMSVEVDTSETVSPTLGADGNHRNDATGGDAESAGGLVTVKVTGWLAPTLPAASRCTACAV